MLDVFVMQPAEARAVGGIERAATLANADDVMHLDPSAARDAHTFEPGSDPVSCPHQLACLLPTR